ncbi:MAG: hypothetical protein AB3N63_19825 [Puniceicoccaceae bacterium]
MLRLKEKPSEWIKFTAVIGLVPNIILWLLWWRGLMSVHLPIIAAIIALGAVLLAMARPYWFRGFYRGGMTISFYIGQVIGSVLLTLFFFLMVTPMGLILRLLGKDLLNIRKRKEGSYWSQANCSREFDRMF